MCVCPFFFDAYPRFYETAATKRLESRFHQRSRMIVDENKDVFVGARVLDLASHDGRWAFAAFKAGAAYVEGVEGRPELVRHSIENFYVYGVPQTQFAFTCADVVGFLERRSQCDKFDVVLNLVFLSRAEASADFGVLFSNACADHDYRHRSEHVKRRGHTDCMG